MNILYVYIAFYNAVKKVTAWKNVSIVNYSLDS